MELKQWPHRGLLGIECKTRVKMSFLADNEKIKFRPARFDVGFNPDFNLITPELSVSSILRRTHRKTVDMFTKNIPAFFKLNGEKI